MTLRLATAVEASSPVSLSNGRCDEMYVGERENVDCT